MKKIQSLGESLTKSQQKQIVGGTHTGDGCGHGTAACTQQIVNTLYQHHCSTDSDCWGPGLVCEGTLYCAGSTCLFC